MGKKAGFRQYTLYIEPLLYEKVRQAAMAFGEHIYEFMDEAFRSAVDRRVTGKMRDVINFTAEKRMKERAKTKKVKSSSDPHPR